MTCTIQPLVPIEPGAIVQRCLVTMETNVQNKTRVTLAGEYHPVLLSCGKKDDMIPWIYTSSWHITFKEETPKLKSLLFEKFPTNYDLFQLLGEGGKVGRGVRQKPPWGWSSVTMLPVFGHIVFILHFFLTKRGLVCCVPSLPFATPLKNLLFCWFNISENKQWVPDKHW